MRSRISLWTSLITGRRPPTIGATRAAMPRHVAAGGARGLLCLALATSGCSSIGSVFNTNGPAEGAPGHVTGFLGGVVADEPRAALAAREVLSSGGTAGDAATALALMLTVTLPSRAGLGGGGACLAYSPSPASPGSGQTEAILFLPGAPSSRPPGDRPAAVPLMARGLYALHARYGQQQFESLVAPAEQSARFGTQLSRALARDIAVVAGPLSADPAAAAVFTRNGQALPEGSTLLQPDLGATLAQMRVAGVGDLYQGTLARQIADASALAGGAIPADDLRAARPRVAPALIVRQGDDLIGFLPPPADGGLATAAALRVLISDPSAVEAAGRRALAAAVAWRRGGVADPASLIEASLPGGTLPALPASTTFATVDRAGNAVVCALTMNNLFGTGRIAPGTGILLAASPAAVPVPLLSAAIVYNTNLPGFRAAVGGSGQDGAPLAAADVLAQTLRLTRGFVPPTAPPEPGRANLIACSRYLPADDASCGWVTDPRGDGLAAGAN